MKIIAIPTIDGKDCVYVSRRGMEELKHSDEVICDYIQCDCTRCENCQLASHDRFVRLDDLEYYVFNQITNAEAEAEYKKYEEESNCE